MGDSEAIVPELIGVLVHARSGPGRIVSVDAAAARAAGAIVLTGAQTLDIDPYIGPIVRDRPLLAIDRVRYVGEPLAVVAAKTEEAARAAAELVAVEIAPLSPAVTGAAPGEPPLVHLTDLLRPGPLGVMVRELTPGRGNQLAEYERQFEEDFEDEARPKPIDERVELPGPDPDERFEAVARWDVDGGVTLQSAYIFPIQIWDECFTPFDVDPKLVRISDGAATSMAATHLDGLAALLAKRTGRAVKMVARAGDFGWSGPRVTLRRVDYGLDVTLDVGAAADLAPLLLADIGTELADELAPEPVTIRIVYSERPPVGTGSAGWMEAAFSW